MDENGWIFNKKVDLTEEFFEYFKTLPVKSNIKRCSWETVVIDKNTMEILSSAYTNDLENELPFVIKARKIFHLDENELKNRDLVLSRVLEFIEQTPHKCIYVKEVFWSHIAHEDFCPRPGIIMRYFVFE